MRLDSYLQRYTTSRLTGLAAQEKLNLIQALQKFLNYMGDVDVEDLTKSDLVRFAQWLKTNYTPATAQLTLKASRRALTAHRTLHLRDWQGLFQYIPDPELKGFLLVLSWYGLHVQEALSLQLRDGRLVYQCARTGRWVALLLSPEHAGILKGLTKETHVFPQLKCWKSSAIEAEIAKYAPIVGLRGKDVSFSSLRRFYVRYALQEGA